MQDLGTQGKMNKRWGSESSGGTSVSGLSPESETGVLNSRPKLLRFHMPGPATHPYMANKKAR
jgi:hypothetical protein